MLEVAGVRAVVGADEIAVLVLGGCITACEHIAGVGLLQHFLEVIEELLRLRRILLLDALAIAVVGQRDAIRRRHGAGQAHILVPAIQRDRAERVLLGAVAAVVMRICRTTTAELFDEQLVGRVVGGRRARAAIDLYGAVASRIVGMGHIIARRAASPLARQLISSVVGKRRHIAIILGHARAIAHKIINVREAVDDRPIGLGVDKSRRLAGGVVGSDGHVRPLEIDVERNVSGFEAGHKVFVARCPDQGRFLRVDRE